MSTLYDIGYNDAMKEMVDYFTSNSYQNQVKASLLKEILDSDKFERACNPRKHWQDFISREALEDWLSELGSKND